MGGGMGGFHAEGHSGGFGNNRTTNVTHTHGPMGGRETNVNIDRNIGGHHVDTNIHHHSGPMGINHGTTVNRQT